MTDIVETKIENLIYEIRGKQVMLDSDLARLYGCTNGTKDINLAVKRNLKKFENYCFQINEMEYQNLRFQFETANINKMSRVMPHVFTEEGVLMLATILKTETAIKMSIKIVNAFVEMRKIISNKIINYNEVNNMLVNHDYRIKLLEESFDKLEEKEKKNYLFFEGQYYDAYSLLVDILKEAKKEIIIIDNYIDKSVLDIISLLEKEVIIITNKYNNTDIEKYKKQYDNLKIIINNKFHDRFIIIDKKILYHSGASFKDIGNKCFSINKIEDEKVLIDLIERINI